MTTHFECIIPERPVSQQTRRRDRLREWKALVAKYARESGALPTACVENRIALTLIYLFEEAALDADNIVKPIQDALVGLVYDDDSIVTDVLVRKRSLQSDFAVENLSPSFAAGFDLGREFIYVLVTDAPPQGFLL